MRLLKVWLALAALAASSARAETIRAIEFQGLKLLPAETLSYYLGIAEGQELDESALNRNLHDLWSRNLIDDLKIDRVPVDGGVKLVISVVERPILRSLDYQGLKRVSRTDVNERISKEAIEVREGSPLNLGELKRLQSTIEAMYREKGFRFAQATYTLEEVSPTERRVVFQIDEAERVRIGDLKFTGNKVYGDWRLKWTMKKTKETNLLWRMLKKDIYNPATVDEDLQKVRDLYRGIGYKNVEVEDPLLSVLQKGGGKRRLGVEIPVVEGERWKLGKISIEGEQVFREQALLSKFGKSRGGWLRSKLISDGAEAIHETYRNYGHIFASVDTEVREREGNVADLVVNIQEGDQYKVGRMEFQGNTRTHDKVLRREFRIQEGTLLNMGGVKSSLFKVNQLGYFKLKEDDPIQFENFDTEKKTVDLLVQGEESDRTELQVGAGWSETYGFFGTLSVKTQNFLGRGETVGVSYQSGRYQDEFDVSYYIPWWLDRPQSLGLQVYKSNLNYSYYVGQDYERKSDGAVLTYGRNLGLFSSASVSFTQSKLKDRLAQRVGDNVLQQSYDISNSSIRPAFSYDSRDSRMETTVGTRYSASLEFAGGFLGGDNYFWRPETQFSYFLPLTRAPVKTLAAFNIEAGWVEPFSGHEVLPLERYFLGGENSVRGFQFRSLWVRDEKTDEPVYDNGFYKGGNKYFQMNLEYHFLLGGPFRMILFADGANVYDDNQRIDPTRLRYSAGAELRIFVPVFGAPLRFIYATNLDPRPEDQFESFQFSIGATF